MQVEQQRFEYEEDEVRRSRNDKLAVVDEIVRGLAERNVVMTTSAVRTRLRSAMMVLARASCDAFGIELDDDELERVANSKGFQEAVANILRGQDIY